MNVVSGFVPVKFMNKKEIIREAKCLEKYWLQPVWNRYPVPESLLDCFSRDPLLRVQSFLRLTYPSNFHIKMNPNKTFSKEKYSNVIVIDSDSL